MEIPKIKIELRTISQLTYRFEVTKDDIQLIRDAMEKGEPKSIALGDYLFNAKTIESIVIKHPVE